MKTFTLASIPASLFPVGVMTEDQIKARPDWAIFPEEKEAILSLEVGQSVDHDTVRWTRRPEP